MLYLKKIILILMIQNKIHTSKKFYYIFREKFTSDSDKKKILRAYEKVNDRYTNCYHALLSGKYDVTFYKDLESRLNRYSHTIFFQYNDHQLW